MSLLLCCTVLLVCRLIVLQNKIIQWNVAIKWSDITNPSYKKVILLVPALYISLGFFSTLI